MTDYVWPSDLIPYAVSFYLQPHTGGTESPFSRTTKVYGLSAPRWVCSLSFRGGYNGTTAQNAFGPRLDAMVAKLKGRENRVALYDWRRPSMRSPLWPATPGNNAAAAGASIMTLTGLTAGTVVYEGDYIGGDGRPHIITVGATADGSGNATVRFEPPLVSAVSANSAEFGNPTGLFRLVSDDAGQNGVEVGEAQIITLDFVEDPFIPESFGVLFKRPVFGWDEDAAVDSARFGSYAPLTDTTGVVAYSQRDAPTNDGETGMRLVVADYTLNTSAESLTMSPYRVVATPTGYTSGIGACWANQILKLATGRLLLFYTELNSPDGTYTNAASRYDVKLKYSDDDGQTWSHVGTIVGGENANINFGLADYNTAAAGMNIPGGVNVAVQMDSGRIVLAGFLPASGTNYLVSVYTDDPNGTSGWTYGTARNYLTTDYNEPSIAITPTGLAAFVRRESAAGRIVYTSTSGASWTFSHVDTGAAIRNVASAAYSPGGSRIFVGGATTAGDNRLGYQLFETTDAGATFPSSNDDVFEAVQRIGYTHMNRIAPGYYGILYEVTSNQVGNSFNQKASIGMAVFNEAVLNGVAVPASTPDSELYDAATEYASYAAWVTGDGGAVQNATTTQAAIARAIAGNYYSGIGFCFLAYGGQKSVGGTSTKFYSIGPRIISSSAGLSTSLVLDTTTFAYPVIKFPDGGAFILWNDVVVREGSTLGLVLIDKASDTGVSVAGIGVQWTDSVVHYLTANGTFSIGGTSRITGSPVYQTTNTEVGHFIIDFDERMGIHGKDGVDKQSVTYFPSYTAAGETAQLKVYGVGGTNRFVPEMWFFNGASRAAIRQCAIDMAAIY